MEYPTSHLYLLPILTDTGECVCKENTSDESQGNVGEENLSVPRFFKRYLVFLNSRLGKPLFNARGQLKRK